MVQPLYMLFKGGCTSDGKVGVVSIRALRRGKALEPYGSDGDILIIAHGVDGSLYFGKFVHIAAVIGIDYRLVYREVNESRA